MALADLRPSLREAAAGLTLAVPLGLLFVALPAPRAREAIALALAVIAAIYVGFALAHGSRRQLVLQIGGAVGFLGLTLVGLWGWPGFLVVGLVGHGLWDALAHGPHGLTTRPRWYAGFCAVVDVILAAFAAAALLA